MSQRCVVLNAPATVFQLVLVSRFLRKFFTLDSCIILLLAPLSSSILMDLSFSFPRELLISPNVIGTFGASVRGLLFVWPIKLRRSVV